MKKIILVFGMISGAISISLMLASMKFEDKIGFDKAEYIGYTVLVLSFMLVYFGIRSYRDNVAGGEITFAKGFVVGLGITLISSACYVGIWEILYFNFLPGFIDKYNVHIIQKLQDSGASAAVVQAKVEELKKFKVMYDKPLFNAAMTFLEPFPVGLVITLISAAVLRKKPQGQMAQTAVTAS
jgi:hypothetical protein